MSRFVIHMAYNGANYCGWQVQPSLPTVQQTMEHALGTLLRDKVAVVGCGRTDTGVHASDFYAHFDFCGDLPNQLLFKLNNFLPADIAVYDVFGVSDDFHARFSAVSRTYQYHVSTAKLPFKQGLYSRVFFEPDVDAMNAAGEILLEYDDFTSFAKLHTDNKTNICHLTNAVWQKCGDEVVFTITSNRFLRNMVRSITGTMLDVGRGRIGLVDFRRIIERKNRCAAGVSMPAQGLFLTKVDYSWDNFKLN